MAKSGTNEEHYQLFVYVPLEHGRQASAAHNLH